ncbi:MAG: SusD/RagB family nutrient-binding outer membrane lipoprotein, partial [Chlorobi bacterium]|nr:SusD/RagB family nutrient-binding outer membrane lipoprotein [Chlorobiota bacterium]
IIASMEFNGIENADILTYLSQSDVQYNSNNWQMLIGTQKWIALYSQGIQAWAEWRRLKYPSLIPGVNAVTPTIPRRRAYPSVEYSSNFENVSNAVENIGGEDSFLGKVWWDQ